MSATSRESRRLSFRALDIEQIGHVYEGLLDHTARRAPEVILVLEGKDSPEVRLSDIVRRSQEPGWVEWLCQQTGRTPKAVEKALNEGVSPDPFGLDDWQQIAPFTGLVRKRQDGGLEIVPGGSLYVTAGATRRQTGTQYTPRTLTESVVEHALAPQVYVGPAEGLALRSGVSRPPRRFLG